MTKKKKSVSAKWIVVIILAAVICIASAAAITSTKNSSKPLVPGVHVGDTFYYNVTGSYIVFTAGANPDEEYPGFLELNQTDYYKVTITGINGTIVSLTDDWVFKNGTDIQNTQTINIANGQLGDKNGFWGIYAPNLNVNDLLCPKGGDSDLIVNSTLTQMYADSSRQTNCWSISNIFYNTEDPTHSTYQLNTMDVLFDKQTGIMTAMTNFVQYNNPEMNIAITWTLTSCTMWTV